VERYSLGELNTVQVISETASHLTGTEANYNQVELTRHIPTQPLNTSTNIHSVQTKPNETVWFRRLLYHPTSKHNGSILLAPVNDIRAVIIV